MNSADGVLIVIGSEELQATFVPALGMLGTSLRLHDAEFLALPGGIPRYRAGHQTGLPLLAPWANRLSRDRLHAAGVDVDLGALQLGRDGRGLPIHGTMTAVRGWEIIERSPAHAKVRFDYGARADLLAAFPFPHEIALEVAVRDNRLTVTTTVTPTSTLDVPVSFGWHPFLRLPRGDRSAWTLHVPDLEHLELDAAGIPTGRTTAGPETAGPVGHRTFDDLYALGAENNFALEYEGTRLDLSFESGYPFAQLYVPPRADFVSVEPMTAATDALVRGDAPLVASGSSYSAWFSIAVT